MTSFTVSGNTYELRFKLRELGGTWNASAEVWDMPAGARAEVDSIVNPAPAGDDLIERRAVSTREVCICLECGQRAFSDDDQPIRHSRHCESQPQAAEHTRPLAGIKITDVGEAEVTSAPEVARQIRRTSIVGGVDEDDVVGLVRAGFLTGSDAMNRDD